MCAYLLLFSFISQFGVKLCVSAMLSLSPSETKTSAIRCSAAVGSEIQNEKREEQSRKCIINRKIIFEIYASQKII